MEANQRIVSIDPGESIGLIYYTDDRVYGYTIKGDDRLLELWHFLQASGPNTIVYEEFALRQSAAQKLVGSKFITCEVVGVIKLWSRLNNCQLIPLIPMNKEYCGFSSNPKDEHYKAIEMINKQKITEHTRDAYRLFSYAKLFKEILK